MDVCAPGGSIQRISASLSAVPCAVPIGTAPDVLGVGTPDVPSAAASNVPRSGFRLPPLVGLLGVCVVALLGTLLVAAPTSAQQNVRGTVHNLSTTGTGLIVASTESEVCVFCHTPHSANTQPSPLWNKNLSDASYTPYNSPSIQSSPGQPNGYSKLCLSCHDGTIAVGSVLNVRMQTTTIDVQNTNEDGTLPSGETLIGQNLLNDHPVSFTFDGALASDDGELVDPSTLTGSVHLYPGTDLSADDAVQCTSCHDPHTDQNPKFLRKSQKGQSDNLCITCHQKAGWAGSSHESSAEPWPAGQTSEEVRDHSCVACHDPHTSSGAERLLRDGVSGGESAIEQACYQCHTSSGSGGIAPNIETEFSKSYRHPITTSPGDHKPVFIPRPAAGLPENVVLSPGSPAEDSRFTDATHVECVDCHNPHRVLASNRTEGMRGVDLDGSEVGNVQNDPAPTDGEPSTRQYPVCLRCHGDSYADVLGTAPLASGANPGNKRTQFQTTNSAFHPVGGPGRNTSSNLDAQLSPNGLGTSSVLKCTDCHNNDAYEATSGRPPSSGGTDDTPVGPHGSAYPSILRARYWSTLPGPSDWNADNFDLCFRCHDVTRLVVEDRMDDGARTNFYDEDYEGRDNLHTYHLDDRANKAQPICKSCHYEVHSNVEAPNTQYNIDGVVYDSPPDWIPTRLVNFHPSIEPIGGRAKPEWWLDTSTKERRCYLQCHTTSGSSGGDVMSGYRYRPPSGDLP